MHPLRTPTSHFLKLHRDIWTRTFLTRIYHVVAPDDWSREQFVLVVVDATHLTDLYVLLVLHHVLSYLMRKLKWIHFCHEVVVALVTLMLIAAQVIGRAPPFILIALGCQRALNCSSLVFVTERLEFNVLSALLNLCILPITRLCSCKSWILMINHLFDCSSLVCWGWIDLFHVLVLIQSEFCELE